MKCLHYLTILFVMAVMYVTMPMVRHLTIFFVNNITLPLLLLPLLILQFIIQFIFKNLHLINFRILYNEHIV